MFRIFDLNPNKMKILEITVEMNWNKLMLLITNHKFTNTSFGSDWIDLQNIYIIDRQIFLSYLEYSYNEINCLYLNILKLMLKFQVYRNKTI